MSSLSSRIILVLFFITLIAVLLIGFLWFPHKCTIELQDRLSTYSGSDRVPDKSFQTCGFGSKDNLGNDTLMGKILGFEDYGNNVLLTAEIDGQNIKIDLGSKDEGKVLFGEYFNVMEVKVDNSSLTKLSDVSPSSLSEKYKGMFFVATIWPLSEGDIYSQSCKEELAKRYSQQTGSSSISSKLGLSSSFINRGQCFFKSGNIYTF